MHDVIVGIHITSLPVFPETFPSQVVTLFSQCLVYKDDYEGDETEEQTCQKLNAHLQLGLSIWIQK